MRKTEYRIRIDEEIADNLKLLVAAIRDCPLIEEFCGKNKTRLTSISLSRERGKPEPAYKFLGSSEIYLRNGLRATLNYREE